MKKNIIVFGKITGIGWFVVILTLISVLLGRWIGNKLGMPILFASVSGIIGVIISLVGIRASIKDILNQEIDLEELKEKIIENFEKNFDANLVYDN